MAKERISEEDFMRLFPIIGATGISEKTGVNHNKIYQRRRNIEKSRGVILNAPTQYNVEYPGRVPLQIQNGQVLIGSDFHIWPGDESTCLRAFKKLVRDIQPSAIILNGDVLDFPRISRHPQNWERAPDPQEEIEAAQDHLNDIEQGAKRGTKKIWPIGNHDIRFESMFANSAPQMRGVKGVHLSDHFPNWQKAMSCLINEGVEGGTTMVKHRYKGGMNATRANTLNAGISMVTGHLHCQNVRPLSDYRPFDRYGVDTGCVADKNHRAFSYCEDSPLDWRSGFALLTFKEGRLMYPELISKWSDNSVQFRGQVIKV